MKGQRVQMDEAALYTVKDGRVVKEEFFYQIGVVAIRLDQHDC